MGKKNSRNGNRVFLKLAKTHERVSELESIRERGEWLPISLAEDLLALELTPIEQQAIIRVTNSSDNLALENFFTRFLHVWNQDIALAALIEWSERTERVLWHRVAAVASHFHLPQRVRFGILLYLHRIHGPMILKSQTEFDGLGELSFAFHNLLIHKHLQWNVEDKTVHELSLKSCESLEGDYASNKALPSSLCYLARFDPESLIALAEKPSITEVWRPIIASLSQQVKSYSKVVSSFEKFVKSPPKTKLHEKLIMNWPLVWHRSQVEPEQLTVVTKLCHQLCNKAPHDADVYGPFDWTFFAGLNVETMREVLLNEKSFSDEEYIYAINRFTPFLQPFQEEVLAECGRRLGNSKDPASFLNQLDPIVRFDVSSSASSNKVLENVHQERVAVLEKLEKRHKFLAEEMEWDAVAGRKEESPAEVEGDPKAVARKRFFQIAYGGQVGLEPLGDGYWRKLAEAYQRPSEDCLADLSEMARKEGPIFQICYLNTLARFEGIDRAALKLLDFIRVDDEPTLLAVIRALAGIASDRAHQELVSCLTRPNMTLNLQLEIANLLKGRDLGAVQAELRSAIKDLGIEPKEADERLELKENLTLLLTASEEAAPETNSSTDPVNLETGDDGDLDKILIERIPHFPQLSSEVKRSLRTAQFFHAGVTKSSNKDSIDLSPAIDMQYKALELLFREAFESEASLLIHDGILQRKLDILGYARPITAKMDDFEYFVGALPTINSIPYFSKFKLRKMLRAICQFRPGKRFTLDGLKAFALFFACFSRKKCRYGLENLFPLPYATDGELFEFVKSLHVFQDFRNRAAHEGFRPDARSDIDGIWRESAVIIEHVFAIKEFHAKLHEFRSKRAG